MLHALINQNLQAIAQKVYSALEEHLPRVKQKKATKDKPLKNMPTLEEKKSVIISLLSKDYEYFVGLANTDSLLKIQKNKQLQLQNLKVFLKSSVK